MGVLSSTGKSNLQGKGVLNNNLQVVRDNKQVKQICCCCCFCFVEGEMKCL